MVTPKLKKIHAGNLHVSKPTWWLTSRFHFSFADYFSPENVNFGALRVLNDDLVQGGAGFGRHSHRNAEIFSYIVDGWLTHQDSMGNKESLPRGCVQYLSAGSGIWHSEMNEHDHACRFLQVWLTPAQRNLSPNYGSRSFQKADRHNRLLHLLGGTQPAPKWPSTSEVSNVMMQQDANVYVSECDPGTCFDLSLGRERQLYIVCIEGALLVGKEMLGTRDAVEVVGGVEEAGVQLRVGDEGGHFMVIEMRLG